MFKFISFFDHGVNLLHRESGSSVTLDLDRLQAIVIKPLKDGGLDRAFSMPIENNVFTALRRVSEALC